MKRVATYLLISAAFICATAQQNETIVLTGPLNAVEQNDIAEFSRSIAGRPWDMDDVRDIGFDYNFTQPTVSDGIWSAVFLETGAFFYPLFKGYAIPGDPHCYPLYSPGMPYGGINPINADRFKRLSIRMSLPRDGRSNVFFSWTKSLDVDDGWYLAFPDGEYTQMALAPDPDGFRIYNIDMTAEDFFAERRRDMFDVIHNGGWNGMIRGLVVQPSNYGPAGTETCVDWIRLYNPDESPAVPITWRSPSWTADGDYFVRLYIDDDEIGYDGDLFMSGLVNDGAFDLKTGALPPGDYYVYLELAGRGTGENYSMGFSEYSARITVLAPPAVEILAPSYTSGADYATTELDNPWDMSDSSDIDLNHVNQMSGLTFQDSVLTATANPNGLPAHQTDAYMWLNLRRGSQLVPIDASRYRYLTFRMQVEGAGYTNAHDRMSRGWGSVVVWSSDGLGDLAKYGSYSQEIPLLEEWRSYTVDLWDDSLLEVNATIQATVAQVGWTNSGRVAMFRFDPLETPPTVFHLDDIKLCAMNRPSDGVYIIRWNAFDPKEGELTVRLFAGRYNASGAYVEDSEPLAVLSQKSGENSYEWNTAGRESGEYYIRIEALDECGGGDSQMSRVPVLVSSEPERTRPDMVWFLYWGWPGAIPVSGDYDGDGTSDLAVYDSNTGYWYVINVWSEVLVWAFPWGWPGANPVSGDFDGDGRSDIAVMDENTGYWYIYSLTQGILKWDFPWGWPGVVPVPGYYDNDAITDIGIFDLVTGNWYLAPQRNQAIWAVPLSWGWPGAWPVPGDYDGDGLSDLAVFDQNTGAWFVRSVAGRTLVWDIAWGWPGAWPVSGDYDGDGRNDLAVFDQNTGAWYVLSVDEDVIAWDIAWGWPGAWPVPGDYVGDRRGDFAVFDQNTGAWFVRPVEF